MSYQDFIKEPVLMAVFSALTGTIIAYIGTKIYDSIKSTKSRKSTIGHLKRLLEKHKDRLNEIPERLGTNQVHAPYSVQPLYNIIHSEAFEIKNDEDLLVFLYDHIEGLEGLNRAYNIMDIRSGGFTNIQDEANDRLEENLAQIIPDLITNIDNAIEEINKK